MVKPAFKYKIDRFVHRPEISNELSLEVLTPLEMLGSALLFHYTKRKNETDEEVC